MRFLKVERTAEDFGRELQRYGWAIVLPSQQDCQGQPIKQVTNYWLNSQ
jgi:hypothetical protein